MNDLIAFLRAELDKDEALARAATAGPWHWSEEEFEGEPCVHSSEWAAHGPTLHGATDTVLGSWGYDASGTEVKRADGEHIARHDPARVLADVAWRSQVLADYEATEEIADRRLIDGVSWETDEEIARRLALESVCRAWAQAHGWEGP